MSGATVGAHRGMARRGFLAGAAALTGAALTSTAPAGAARAAETRAPNGADTGPLALTNVTVIDGSGAPQAPA